MRHVSKAFLMCFLALTVALGGCAAKSTKQQTPPGGTGEVVIKSVPKPEAGQETGGSGVQGDKSAEASSGTVVVGKPKIDVTPFTRYQDGSPATGLPDGNIYDDCYTRFKVVGTSHEFDSSKVEGQGSDAERRARYKADSFLKKFFSNNSCDVSLGATVKVGQYTDFINLLTLLHFNDKKGEFWSQTVSHSMLDYPLFLVRGDARDAVPEFQVTLKGTEARQSAVAGKLLETAVGSISTLSPKAKVLTTLTADSTTKRAQAIDASISSLFSSGITERHVSQRDLRYAQDEKGVTISLSLPEDDCDWDSDLMDVGSWTISFDAPRPSVFSNYRICTKATDTDGMGADKTCKKTREAALNAVKRQLNDGFYGRVLNFELETVGAARTIRSYLIQQKWYTSGEASFTGQRANDVKVANTLCQNIANEILTLGLNEDDAAFVVRSVIEGLPHNNTGYSRAFIDAAYCKDMVARTQKDSKGRTLVRR